MSEYMRPISTPLVSNASVKPQSSMDLLDRDFCAHRSAAAILVGDFGSDLGFLRARVERLDHAGVLLGNDLAPELARAGDLGVVGVEILGQQKEPPHAGWLEQAEV